MYDEVPVQPCPEQIIFSDTKTSTNLPEKATHNTASEIKLLEFTNEELVEANLNNFNNLMALIETAYHEQTIDNSYQYYYFNVLTTYIAPDLLDSGIECNGPSVESESPRYIYPQRLAFRSYDDIDMCFWFIYKPKAHINIIITSKS